MKRYRVGVGAVLERSFLSAGCLTGSWMAKGRAQFDDGTEVGLTHLFSCTPQGSSK